MSFKTIGPKTWPIVIDCIPMGSPTIKVVPRKGYSALRRVSRKHWTGFGSGARVLKINKLPAATFGFVALAQARIARTPGTPNEWLYFEKLSLYGFSNDLPGVTSLARVTRVTFRTYSAGTMTWPWVTIWFEMAASMPGFSGYASGHVRLDPFNKKATFV